MQSKIVESSFERKYALRALSSSRILSWPEREGSFVKLYNFSYKIGVSQFRWDLSGIQGKEKQVNYDFRYTYHTYFKPSMSLSSDDDFTDNFASSRVVKMVPLSSEVMSPANLLSSFIYTTNKWAPNRRKRPL